MKDLPPEKRSIEESSCQTFPLPDVPSGQEWVVSEDKLHGTPRDKETKDGQSKNIFSASA